jgi:hypothetical protein
MRSRSLVGLAVLVRLAFGLISADAQTMKIATQTSATVKLSKAPAGAPAAANLNIVCQSNGTAVLEFLVATASGGTAPYEFSNLAQLGTAIAFRRVPFLQLSHLTPSRKVSNSASR